MASAISPVATTDTTTTLSNWSNLNESRRSDGPNSAVSDVTFVAAVCSAIGASVIILSYIVWPDIRTRSRTYILFISIADLFVATANAVGSSGASKPQWKFVADDTNVSDPVLTGETLCKVQAAWGTVGMLSSIMWSVTMAVYLYVHIVKDDGRLAERTFMVSCVFCTIVPVAIVAAAAAYDMLGWDSATVSVGWCWIRSGTDVSWKQQLLWRLLAGKAWEIPSYVIIPVLYCLVKRHISAATKFDDSSSQFLLPSVVRTMTRTDRKLTWIPVLFLLLHMWGTLRFIIELVKDLDGSNSFSSHHYVALEVLQGIGDSSQGTANCILFVLLTAKLRQRLCFCWRRCTKVKVAANLSASGLSIQEEDEPLINSHRVKYS